MCSCAFASIRPTPPQSGGVTRSNVPTQCADLWDPVVDGGRSYLGTGLRPCEPIVVFRTTIGAQHGLSGGLRPQWWTRFIKGCIAPVMVADGPARPPRAVESPALTSSASVVAACCDVESSIANKIQRPEGALHVICHVESSVTKIEHSAESRSHPHKSTDASTATIHANTANNNDPAPFSISPLLMPTAEFHGGRRNHHLGSSAGSHHGVLNRPSDAQAGEAPVLHVANHHSTTTTTSTPSMAHKPTTTSQPPGLLFKLSLLLPASAAPSPPPSAPSSPPPSPPSSTLPSESQQSDTDISAIEESSASSNEHSTERSATSLHESEASSHVGASDGEHVPSTALKRPQNFYYVDQRPTDGEVPSSFFKAFKYIRGPKGNLMKIKFNNGLDKAYKTLCFGGPGCVEGGCLKDAQHECDCSKNNKKRGTDSSGGEREASQRRRMGALEDAFGA